MSDKLERLPDELWTSYLQRRLEEIGLPYTVYSPGSEILDLEEGVVAGLDFSIAGREVPIVRTERFLHQEDVNDCLVSASTLEKLAQDLALVSGEATIVYPQEDGFLKFYFHNGGVSVEEESLLEVLEAPIFAKYNAAGTYTPQEVIDDIVQHALSLKPESGFPKAEELKQTQPQRTLESRTTQPPAPQREPKTPSDPRLDEILETVRSLDRRTAQHPVVMKSEGAYLQELYVRAINEDVNNLHVFEFDGQRIPYVLIHSSDLEGVEGKVGKPFGNLYLVARDMAPEEWQQKIVAYHESLCAKRSHETAKAQELVLAKSLGKEPEYQAWRAEIDNGKLK